MIFAEDKEFTVTDGMPDVKVDDRIFSFYTAEKDQIKLIYDIFSTSSPYGGLREGGYKLALALGRKSSEAKEIIDKLLSGSYHISALSAKIFPETFSDMLEILQKNKADDIGMLKDEITRYNQEEYDDKIFEEFADIFGLDVLKYKSNIKYIIQYINELNNEKMNDDYESGLSNMVVVLPTANKNLSQLTFIPSIIMDLKRTAEKCCSNHEIWKDVPLFVFDQTKDAESLNKNKNFIHSLQQETNARIAFIDMKQIKELGEIFNIESLFDTTGKENAGYGGGRNIASFLGALIGHAVKSGFFDLNAQNIVEIIGKEKDRYKRELDDILTGKNKIKLIMGDDDTTVLPGFFAAKAFQAFQYKERSLYSSVKGFGRASIVVPMSLDSKAYLGKEYFSKPEDSLILALSIIQSGWINDTNMIEFPLAGALVSPLFCLDLPLPSEEKNFTNFQENINDILARAVHHCGDRIGNWEERLYNFTLYREQLNMASWLTLSEKDSRLLFWNSLGKESADASEMTLKKVFTLAAADSARTERARTFLELIQRAPSRFSQDYPRQEIHDAIKKSMLEELASEQGQKQENGEILTPLKMLFCSHADMVAWNVIKGVGDDYRVFMELRKQLADRLLRPEKDGKNTFESKVEKKDWNSFEKIIQEARKATEEFMVREHIDKSHIRLADTFEAAARSCLYRFGNIAQTLADMGGTDTSSST